MELKTVKAKKVCHYITIYRSPVQISRDHHKQDRSPYHLLHWLIWQERMRTNREDHPLLMGFQDLLPMVAASQWQAPVLILVSEGQALTQAASWGWLD